MEIWCIHQNVVINLLNTKNINKTCFLYKEEIYTVMEEKHYSFQDILEFLGFDYEFNKEEDQYPFNRNREDIYFSWGEIIIPKYGIKDMVKNKISDIEEKPISEINMIYNIPFYEESATRKHCGVISKNISLTFRYDKEYKYGAITKSIYEVCFWILEHAIKTNDFYIITDDLVQDFMSKCVINNQWGLGRMVVCSTPIETLRDNCNKSAV